MKRSLFSAMTVFVLSAFLAPLLINPVASAAAAGDVQMQPASALLKQPKLPAPSVPAAPKAPSADQKKKSGNLPISFSNQAECQGKVAGKSLDQAKSYAADRAKNRTDQLAVYSGKLNKLTTETKNSYASNAKKYKLASDVGVEVYAHQTALQGEISRAGGKVEARRVSAAAAATPAAVAAEVCAMIYENRVYTYIDSKISNQKTIDIMYRQNSLNKAQYESLKKENKDVSKIANPAATKTKLDSVQAVLDGITADTINAEQAKNPKKTTKVIFAEKLKANPAYAQLKKDLTKESSEGKKAASASKAADKKAAKETAAAAKKTPKLPTEKSTASTKKSLTAKNITESCVYENAQASASAKKGLKYQDDACVAGLKAGFKKEKTANVFCATGGKKWTQAKAPKQVAACLVGYEKGLALRK